MGSNFASQRGARPSAAAAAATRAPARTQPFKEPIRAVAMRAAMSIREPSPKRAAETAVRVRFSLDVSGSEWDVLYFSGEVDSDGGPERQLRGSLSTANRKVGDFVASPMQEEEGPLSARPRRPP